MGGLTAGSELAAVAAQFGWTWADVQAVTERALAASFLPEADRARLLAEVVRPGYAELTGRG
jgi:adenosine deaminase